MARVYFVKAARKDNPVAKKGESYYWWKFRYGGKHYSKTRPRPSQTINSDFLSRMAEINERFTYDFSAEGERDAETLKGMVEDAIGEVEELSGEAEENLGNMPEGLQEGPTGELLQSRVDEAETFRDALDDVDLDDYEGPEVPEEGNIPQEFTDWLQGKLEELQMAEYEGE